MRKIRLTKTDTRIDKTLNSLTSINAIGTIAKYLLTKKTTIPYGFPCKFYPFKEEIIPVLTQNLSENREYLQLV